MSKPRIFIVTASFYPSVGGVQTQARIQSQQLRERDYEATVITFRHNAAWPRRENIGGVPVIRVAGWLLDGRTKRPRLLQRFSYLLAMLVMAWHLWRYRRSYDLLHVRQLNLIAFPTSLVAWLTGKPIVVVVECTDSTVDAQSQHISLARGPLDAATPWLVVTGQERERGDLASLERAGWPIARLTHLLLQHTSSVLLLLSTRMQAYLAAHHFTVPNVQYIPNGVDINRFAPETNDALAERIPTVVCASRLSYQKGIDVLLQAWRLVCEQLSTPARLLIVGDGPLRPQLERMVTALNIAESVEFTGEQQDVVAYLQRATIGVLPSRWEGQPVSLLEAMACALPCVATRVSGSEDIIQSGINGLLVEPEDEQALAQALLALLRAPDLCQRYALAARATVEANYALERVLDSLIDLYLRLTNLPGEAAVHPLSEGKERVSCVE